eukprot:jgi/Ulvmu1/108/UM001_0112.1
MGATGVKKAVKPCYNHDRRCPGKMDDSHTITLQGFEKLTEDAMGTLRLLSDEFELFGLPWNLEVFPQGHVVDASEKGRFMSCYLKLLDVKLLPADELPYVRFEITLVNRTDSGKSFTRVFENQYGQHTNSTWGMPAFLDLSRLRTMQQSFTPDGDLHIRVRIQKLVKARDVAALRGCTVAEVLKPQGPPDSTDAGTACAREQITDWLRGDQPRLRCDAAVVCNAIVKDKLLSRRICRVIDGRTTQDRGHGAAPEACGLECGTEEDHGAAHLGPTLTKLRSVMAHKASMRRLLAHFGGPQPHAAVAACLAVDPASLGRHINEAVAPEAPAPPKANSGGATGRRSMQERWKSVLFDSAGPIGRFFASAKRV